jgi:hypothetical protein
MREPPWNPEKTKMSLKELCEILKPPTLPQEFPTDKDLLAFEAEVSPLPTDYKEFIKLYGTGSVDDFMTIYNPIAGNPHINLGKQIAQCLPVLRECVAFFRPPLPYELAAGKEELLPFGGTDNGDVLAWHKQGLPDTWTVVLITSRDGEWECVDLNMTDFLVSALTGRVKYTTFPDGFPDPAPKFFPV